MTREIDRYHLSAALDQVVQYVARRRSHITVAAFGGAVNTLYLRSRETTHDVDIFGSDFDNQARILLGEAMHDAQQHFSGLGADWLNTRTQMWRPGPLHGVLTLLSEEQQNLGSGRGGEVHRRVGKVNPDMCMSASPRRYLLALLRIK